MSNKNKFHCVTFFFYGAKRDYGGRILMNLRLLKLIFALLHTKLLLMQKKSWKRHKIIKMCKMSQNLNISLSPLVLTQWIDGGGRKMNVCKECGKGRKLYADCLIIQRHQKLYVWMCKLFLPRSHSNIQWLLLLLLYYYVKVSFYIFIIIVVMVEVVVGDVSPLFCMEFPRAVFNFFSIHNEGMKRNI